MNDINPIISWWMTPKLPSVHIFIKKEDRPKGLNELINVYTKKWLVHPIKRRVAKHYLKLLKRIFNVKVIAITGSAGKTTTKEMLTSILKNEGKTVATFKNIDPIYNIPDTILKATPFTKFLILEMGVEYPGEMDYYLWLAEPDLGVITNIYPTHTEFLGDLEGVKKEKIKLVKTLKNKDFAVLNCEDINLKKRVKNINAKIIWYGRESSISAKNIVLKDNFTTTFQLNIFSEKEEIFLPTIGRQFVNNALAASAVAYLLSIKVEDIKIGLRRYKPPEHRMGISKTKEGAVIIDDSYNNNPAAAKRTISTFCEIAKERKKIIVFGDMLELGDNEKEYHRDLGEFISKTKPDYLIGVGKLSKIIVEEVGSKLGRNRIFWVKNENEVSKIIKQIIDKNTFILIKGSRAMGLDKLVDELSIHKS
jgi:UDP-N-acetylmuramoyl-tripeptide--D-alanyl-D-alanine ligase